MFPWPGHGGFQDASQRSVLRKAASVHTMLMIQSALLNLGQLGSGI
jgi:hypothetical protein